MICRVYSSLFNKMIYLTSGFPFGTLSFCLICLLCILTMKKNALHHELLSTWRQSPERATDCPAKKNRVVFTFTLRCVLGVSVSMSIC